MMNLKEKVNIGLISILTWGLSVFNSLVISVLI